VTPADRDRLVAVLGMLGSDHVGERASAGLHATRLLRERRLTWGDVITPAGPSAPPPPRSPPPPEPPRPTYPPPGSGPGPAIPQRHEAVELCRRHPELLTEWEIHFLDGQAARGFETDFDGGPPDIPMTPKQEAALVRICEKLARAGAWTW
jgi:hypothetical protein